MRTRKITPLIVLLSPLFLASPILAQAGFLGNTTELSAESDIENYITGGTYECDSTRAVDTVWAFLYCNTTFQLRAQAAIYSDDGAGTFVLLETSDSVWVPDNGGDAEWNAFVLHTSVEVTVGNRYALLVWSPGGLGSDGIYLEYSSQQHTVGDSMFIRSLSFGAWPDTLTAQAMLHNDVSVYAPFTGQTAALVRRPASIDKPIYRGAYLK